MFLEELLTIEFTLIEEEPEEIDIQDIKKFNEIRDCSTWSNDNLSKNQREIISKINELIKAVKQLDRKIKNKE